eukprot:1298645-Pyramimonas_sp.AAC.1
MLLIGLARHPGLRPPEEQGNLRAGPPSLRPRSLLPFVHCSCCIEAADSRFVSIPPDSKVTWDRREVASVCPRPFVLKRPAAQI